MMHAIAFCVVIMLGFLIEATLGFGGTVAALPICSMIVGIRVAIPAITMIVCAASLAIVIQDRAYIAWKAYVVMLLFMLVGMPVGMAVYTYLPEAPLKIALGFFTVLVALKGFFCKQRDGETSISVRHLICLLAGGMVHGAFSCGGVLTVMYANRAVKDKRAYRVTLSAIWFSLNLLISVKNLLTGGITGQIAGLACISIPFVAAAVAVGNILLRKLDTAAFVKLVYVMLLVSGVLMVMQAA